jgi:DedD protein
MGLFSFGKKDDATSGREAYSDSPRGSRQTVRTERRTRRTERTDADAMMLDPTLPEKQRARRRLVGAIALVLAAVIVLPMVLDSRPKPVTDDIAIDIPNRAAAPVKPSKEAAEADTQAGVAPDNPAPASAGSANVAAGVTQPQAATTPAAPATPAAPPAQTAQAASAPAHAKTEQKAQTQAKAEPKPNTSTATQTPKQPATSAAPDENGENTASTSNSGAATPPASPPGSRFVLQIGAFDDETAAQNWVTKLKSAGVPAYIEHRKLADGSTRSLLRAGPFADRAAATAALQKVRQVGLGGGGNRSASN